MPSDERQDESPVARIADHEPRPRLMARLVNGARGTGAQIALDTAITALVNAALLILGSRLLKDEQLASLTMVQLFATSTVILQRALLLTPGLAARRSIGRPAAIPISWSAFSVTLLALVAGSIAPFALTTTEPFAVRMAVSVAFSAGLLLQDYVRYLLFSRNRSDLAVRMDVLWLVTTIAGMAYVLTDTGWIQFIAAWSASSFITVLLTALLWRRHLFYAETFVSLRETLRLGRWSGLDNLLSIFSNILPMVVTTLALATPLAASYRVLQTGLGPLNIINTTLIAGFGLNSYRLTSREEIARLSKRVQQSTLLLCGATLLYTAVAFTALTYVAQIDVNVALRVGVILSIAALLGAATTPSMAAASALGYQFVGVGIRTVVVVLASTISWMAAAGLVVPWDDPIGVVAVGAALLGIVGWGIGYAYAAKREKARLP